MNLEVYWTRFAEDKLDDIFYYYKLQVGGKFAKNLINGIVDMTIELSKYPKSGQIRTTLR